MEPEFSSKKPEILPLDRIEGDQIILDGKGSFPKKVIILLDHGQKREYRIVKTRNGGFILN